MFNLQYKNLLALSDCLGLEKIDRLYYADNVAITAGSGTSIATDDVGSVHFQKVKINLGGDGVDGSLFSGSVTIAAGSASIGVLGANSGVDIGDVTINNASGGSAVNVQDGGNSITIDSGNNTGSAVPATAFYAGGRDVQANLRGVSVDLQGRFPTIASGDVISVSGNTFVEPLRQPVNATSNGQILISGVANRKIRVINGVLIASAAVTINLKSNNNSDATGPLPLGANGGFQAPMAEVGNFETLVGQSLTISLPSAATVGGWLTYVLI